MGHVFDVWVRVTKEFNQVRVEFERFAVYFEMHHEFDEGLLQVFR